MSIRVQAGMREISRTLKFLAIDRLSSSAVTRGEVTTLRFKNHDGGTESFGWERLYLTHELANDAVEGSALVVQWLARLANAFLASTQGTKILERDAMRMKKNLKSNQNGSDLSLYHDQTRG